MFCCLAVKSFGGLWLALAVKSFGAGHGNEIMTGNSMPIPYPKVCVKTQNIILLFLNDKS
jgi:hypothetical protein